MGLIPKKIYPSVETTFDTLWKRSHVHEWSQTQMCVFGLKLTTPEKSRTWATLEPALQRSPWPNAGSFAALHGVHQRSCHIKGCPHLFLICAELNFLHNVTRSLNQQSKTLGSVLLSIVGKIRKIWQQTLKVVTPSFEATLRFLYLNSPETWAGHMQYDQAICKWTQWRREMHPKRLQKAACSLTQLGLLLFTAWNTSCLRRLCHEMDLALIQTDLHLHQLKLPLHYCKFTHDSLALYILPTPR